MKKIEVTKNNIITNRIILEDNEVDSWLNFEIVNKTFGEPEKEVLVVDENNEEVPAILSAEYSIEVIDITNEVEEKSRKDEIKARGAKARIACRNVLDMISGRNLNAQLNAEQVTYLAVTFSPLVQALTISRPSTAKALILAIEPDGTLITEQLKNDCLEELQDY